jgi:hypothetical protein
MGTTMHVWQELRPFALVMLLIAAACASAVTSCGGGGGNSNGELCQQCGDTDGQCQDSVAVTGNERPSFCGTNDPCTVELRCLRKLDSAQRRCFPADPATNALDILYRCDGARPNPSVAPTTTPTPTPTLTASAAPTPTSTGPTATGSTATPTASTATATPMPTATPKEIAVTVTIDNPGGDFTSSFTATVTYPASKGSFLKGGATDCVPDDGGLTPQDNGSGILTLAFPGDSTGAFAITVDCTFHQIAGQTLIDADLSTSASSNLLSVVIDPLS